MKINEGGECKRNTTQQQQQQQQQQKPHTIGINIYDIVHFDLHPINGN